MLVQRTIALCSILLLVAVGTAAAHGSACRFPMLEPPPPPKPYVLPESPNGYAGPTWEQWRRLREPRGRVTQADGWEERVVAALRSLREGPKLLGTISCALERYRPLPAQRRDVPVLGAFGSGEARLKTTAWFVRAAGNPAEIHVQVAPRAGPAVVLFVGELANGLDPADPRRAALLRYLRSRARASSPATRKLALFEIARLGRRSPGEFASIRDQLRFHAEGGPFPTRPFAAHAVRELIAPAPQPVVDVEHLIAVASNSEGSQGARIDAVRRLGRVGPFASEWEFRWVLPWLAGVRHPEIDRRVAER